MAYYECEAVQSHSGTRLRGLASDGGEHVEARDLGLAAAGLPAADPPLVTRKIPKEGSRSSASAEIPARRASRPVSPTRALVYRLRRNSIMAALTSFARSC